MLILNTTNQQYVVKLTLNFIYFFTQIVYQFTICKQKYEKGLEKKF